MDDRRRWCVWTLGPKSRTWSKDYHEHHSRREAANVAATIKSSGIYQVAVHPNHFDPNLDRRRHGDVLVRKHIRSQKGTICVI